MLYAGSSKLVEQYWCDVAMKDVYEASCVCATDFRLWLIKLSIDFDIHLVNSALRTRRKLSLCFLYPESSTSYDADNYYVR